MSQNFSLARGGVDQTGEEFEGSGLAGSVGPEKGDHFAFFDLEINAVDGANLFASFTYIDEDVADASPLGVVVQGGVFLTDDWELFARYEYGDADDDSEDLSVITFGVNKYWSKHAMKWTTDLGFGIDEVSGNWDKTSVGWREDAPGEDGQFVFRTQLQLLF